MFYVDFGMIKDDNTKGLNWYAVKDTGLFYSPFKMYDEKQKTVETFTNEKKSDEVIQLNSNIVDYGVTDFNVKDPFALGIHKDQNYFLHRITSKHQYYYDIIIQLEDEAFCTVGDFVNKIMNCTDKNLGDIFVHKYGHIDLNGLNTPSTMQTDGFSIGVRYKVLEPISKDELVSITVKANTDKEDYKKAPSFIVSLRTNNQGLNNTKFEVILITNDPFFTMNKQACRKSSKLSYGATEMIEFHPITITNVSNDKLIENTDKWPTENIIESKHFTIDDIGRIYYIDNFKTKHKIDLYLTNSKKPKEVLLNKNPIDVANRYVPETKYEEVELRSCLVIDNSLVTYTINVCINEEQDIPVIRLELVNTGESELNNQLIISTDLPYQCANNPINFTVKLGNSYTFETDD